MSYPHQPIDLAVALARDVADAGWHLAVMHKTDSEVTIVARHPSCMLTPARATDTR